MTMPNNDYIPLPTDSLQLDVEREVQDNPKPGPHRQASGPTILQENDPRFNPPTPSPLKRVALLLFVFGLFWFALKLRTTKLPQPSLGFETERYFSSYTVCDARFLMSHSFSTDFDYRPTVSDERIKNARMRFVGHAAY